MDVEAMRKKAKLAITPAMLKKSKGVSSSIKLTPWYTRRHMLNEDKCSCHVVSYSKPRLHPLKKDIIGIKFKVHRRYSQSKKWRRLPVEFIWNESMSSPMHKFFQAWSESIIKGHGGVIDLVVEPGIRVGIKDGANISEPFVLEPGIQIGTSLKSVVRGTPTADVTLHCFPSVHRQLDALGHETVRAIKKHLEDALRNPVTKQFKYDQETGTFCTIDTSFITKEEVDKMNRK